MTNINKGQDPFTEDFAESVKKLLDEWKVPGVALAVVDDDKIFTQGYGNASVPDTPATPETLWYGASTTKAFTAALVTQLIDSGKYPVLEKGWQTPISSIIRDDFVLPDEWATAHLTLEDAVCHRSGLPRHDKAFQRVVPDEQNEGKMRYTTVRDLTRNLRNLPMTAEPRVKFQYCNTMYAVLSHVIETLTGKPLAEVMKELIWEPLGMSSTYLDLEDAQKGPEPLAEGYHWDEEKSEFVKKPFMPVKEISGAGAILSNVEDYAKWVKCLLHKTQPFSEAAHKEIRQPRFVGSLPDAGAEVKLYGLGWDRAVYNGRVVYGHGGGTLSFGSQVFWIPEEKYGVVGFANTGTTSNAVCDALLYKLIHERFGIAKGDQKDVNAENHSLMNKAVEMYEKGLDITYPNRPDPPIPSPVSIGDLVGTYSHPGYGSVKLRIETDPNNPDKQLLLDDRPYTTWQWQWRLEHVSGTWWIMELAEPKSSAKFTRSWQKAEFHFGPDGKTTGFTVKWFDIWMNASEGDILLKRED